MEKLEKERHQRDEFRGNLDKLIKLESDLFMNTDMMRAMERTGSEEAQHEYEEKNKKIAEEIKIAKELMERTYSVAFPGLMDRVKGGNAREVFSLINPSAERPLDMNWFPSRLEKNS